MEEYRSILSILKSRTFIAFITLVVVAIALCPFATANSLTGVITAMIIVVVATAALVLARRLLTLINAERTTVKMMTALVVMFIAIIVLSLLSLFIVLALPYIPIHRYGTILVNIALGIYTAGTALAYAAIITGAIAALYPIMPIIRTLLKHRR